MVIAANILRRQRINPRASAPRQHTESRVLRPSKLKPRTRHYRQPAIPVSEPTLRAGLGEQPPRAYVQSPSNYKNVRSTDLAVSVSYIHDGPCFDPQEIGHLLWLQVVIAPD
jgi:hypothetical protein